MKWRKRAAERKLNASSVISLQNEKSFRFLIFRGEILEFVFFSQ